MKTIIILILFLACSCLSKEYEIRETIQMTFTDGTVKLKEIVYYSDYTDVKAYLYNGCVYAPNHRVAITIACGVRELEIHGHKAKEIE